MASRRIEIHPYEHSWPAQFEELAARLRCALGEVAVAVDHIGSTSVPGLAAKDVIDIQVSVERLDDPRADAGFARLGAAPTGIVADHVPPGDVDGEAAWRKRVFRPPVGWRPTHLHVRQVGLPNQRYALLFRDFLRADPAAAEAYGRIKTALAAQHPDDQDAYYAVKDPVCDLIVGAAERWARATGWH